MAGSLIELFLKGTSGNKKLLNAEKMKKFNLLPKVMLVVLLGIYCIRPVQAQQHYIDSLKAHYEQKTATYLQKNIGINAHYSFTSSGIEMFASSGDKALNKPEFILYWDEVEAFKIFLKTISPESCLEIYRSKATQKFPIEVALDIKVGSFDKSSGKSPGKPLNGYRIAIDPGHIAGNMEMAKMEKKYVAIKSSPENKLRENISLIEGNLTLETGNLLKQKLESAGAEVLMTRHSPNISAFGITFEQWLIKDFKKAVESALANQKISIDESIFLLNKATKNEIFRTFFNFLDIEERARKINEFNPHLTVIIHYNVDENNSGWANPTNKNFNMAFVGGSFMGEELKEIEDRFEFLRLMVSDDLENSILFSEEVMAGFKKYLDVPVAAENDATYLQKFSLKTAVKGVYTRNLSLTRLVHGTLVYGESLYQDNLNECRLLSQKELKIDNMTCSKRVQQVAEAYYEGVLNYLEKKGN